MLTWLTPIEDLEVSMGPEWVYERKGEKDLDRSWVHKSNSLILATFMSSYAWKDSDLEFELWGWYQLDDDKEGENNATFKIDWRF